jgi:hypothetical protein
LAAADAAFVEEKLVWENGGWEKTRKSAPPPRELELAWQCKQFSCLPYSGGLLDQPAGLIHRMNVAYNVWDAVKTRQSYKEKQADFIKDHPDKQQICRMVEKIRNGN